MKNANSTFISSSFGLSWLRTSLNVAAFACASLLVITSLADAGGAQGARVRRGNVSFSQDGNRLIVRASNGAIIEYDRLSVEAGQIMQFIQPSSSSRVLNRVTGSELTRIDGTLLSNGIVYLVNPQGFRIGGGAVINVGGFFAAAGAMSNSDFVAGRNRFTNLVGDVTNEGLIQAKSVALVGQYVANRGTVDVGDGYVAMGAGDKVFIQDGTGPVMVTVSRSQMGADGSGAGTKAAISNTGTIDAGEGSVTMANGDFYSLAMDLSGTIVGKSIAARGGKGGVLAVNGTLDASSSTGKGGTIDIFGDRVGLFGDALVNASGATGGGSIRIGGDYLGSNAANAPQANRTFIGENARITANATQSGDGGRVIVWSNEYTGFFGTIEASAATSGKGGFIETSSHDNLQAFGSVDASSALGQSGTWLLDPSDVVISAGSAGSLSAGVFDPVGTPASIGVDEINTALNAGTSVIINTANLAGGAGNITMTGAISKTAGSDATLTLNAAGTIVLSQSISSTTGLLSVLLNANESVTMESVINTNGGALTVIARGAVTQDVASVLTIGGTTSVTTGNAAITLNGAGNDFTGAVSLTNTGAFDVSVSSNTALTLGAVSVGQKFSASTTSLINVTDAINTLTGGNGGTVTLDGAAGLTIGAAGDITSDGAVNLTGGGTAGIHTAGNITTTAAVVNFNSATTMDGAVSIDTTNGVSEIGAAILFAGALDGIQALTLNAGAGTISFGGLVGDTQVLASLTVVSAGDISIGNTMKVTGAVSITGNSGVDIFLGTEGAGLSLTDAELDFITEAGSLAITATGAGASITVNNVTGGGNVHGVKLLTSNVDGVFFMTTASTFNNSLAVVANDVAVDALLSVTGSLSFTGNSGVNVIVGTGGVSTNLILSNAELARLTASGGMNVTATGTGATLNVNGVTGGGAITGTTTLSSQQSTITFLNNASTFNNPLALVANNVDVTVALGVTGSISFTGNSGVDVFLGVSGSGLNLTNAELALLTASGGLNVTATGAGSSMTVNGVTGGGAIIGTTTLSSDVDGVTFATTASTFNNALDVVGLTTIAGVNISTTSDSITFSGQVSLTTAGVSINTVSGDITFGNALNGRQALTLTAGAGNITFTGAVGDTTTLASLTVVSAGDISIDSAMKVTGEISITGNSGVDIFLGTADVGGLSLTDTELDFITEAGSLAITATGAGASITVNGVTGGGNVHGVTLLTSNVDGVFFMNTASTFNNSLAVVANDVAVDALLSVTGSLSFTGNSGVNVIVGTGGVSTNLILSNAELARLTASGGMNVTATGTGATLNVNGVTGGGAITGITTLTGSNGVTFSGSASSFNSALKIASIATIESVGVTSTAGGIEFSNSLTLAGGGTSTITSSGSINDDIAILGAVIATGDNPEALIVNAGLGDISFGANIGSSTKRLSALTLTAANTSFAGDVFVVSDLDVGNITLTGATILETDGILTVGVVTGGAFALQLVADALEITDSITNVSVLTIRNIDLDGDISIVGGATFDISQGEWDLIGGTVRSVVLGSLVNTGAITVTGSWINNGAVTVDFLSGGAGEFNVDATVTGTGSLTVHGSGNSTYINADLTQASFNILDSIVVGGGAGIRILTATGLGGIVIDSTGFVDGISAEVAATNLSLLTTFANAPVSVTGTFTAVGGSALNHLTMGGSGVVDAGIITLVASGTILGDLIKRNGSSINLNTNNGTLTAASMYFAENAILTGATILVTTAGDIDFGVALSPATLGGAFGITLTVSGNATFTDLITLTGPAGSFAFSGNNLTLNGVGTNSIGAAMTVTHAGLFTTYNGGLAPTGADLVVGSDFVQNGDGLNSIGGNITSTNDRISFASGVTLTNNVTMTSGLLVGDDISFATVIRSDVSGTRDLTLTAGLGDIALNDGTSTTILLDAIQINSARNVFVGDAITATSFIQLAGTGSTTFTGALSFTGELTVNTGGSVTMNSVFLTNGALTVIAGGAVTQGVGSVLTIDGTTSVTTGAGAITLVGAGTNIFTGAVSLTNTGAFDVSVSSNSALTLGAVSAGRNFSATTASSINVTNTINTLAGANSGTVTLNGAAGLTIGAAGDITSDGAVNLTGGGTGINTAGDITTTAAVVNFNSATTLDAVVSIDTTNGGSEIGAGILFSGALNGSQALTLTAGTGSVAFTGAVGDAPGAAVGTITINSAFNVTAASITATSFIQLAGTGSTTFAGTLLLTGALTVNAGTSLGNTIIFASTVGSVTASSVNLNTLASSARATPATVATIVSGGNIAFRSGTFDMGLNQKITGLGNITIGGLLPATNATAVTLGDVNAVGNLSVNSDAINLLARASGSIVTNTGGTITDPMVDYIVGGRVFFSVAPVMVGSGTQAVFANTSGNVDGSGTLGGFVRSIYQSPITVALLTEAGGQILDLSVANSLALFNPANIIPPQMSILPPIGVLGSSEELEQNEKKKAKPEAQGSKKTASETPKTAPGIPVALR